MADQDIENRKALYSIAYEIKKFHMEQPFCKKYYYKKLYLPQPNFVDCHWYKTSIKAKKKLIASLKKKLSVACIFAKVLLSINANKRIIHSNELSQATLKSSNRELVGKFHEYASTTSKLIDNAHTEIFFNQDKRTEVEKLKEIICYLNATNTMLSQVKAKAEILERKNRFLSTKLLLTENNLRDLINESYNLKKENNKLMKTNDILKNRMRGSDLFLSPKTNESNSTIVVGEKYTTKLHLSNVTFLLKEQAKMINVLRNVSENFKRFNQVEDSQFLL